MSWPHHHHHPFPCLRCDEVLSVPFNEGIQSLTKQLKLNSSTIKVEGLVGSSRALFLTRLIQCTSRQIVVLTSDQNNGEKLISDLKYFYHFNNIKQIFRFFPTWELLPYENLSPLSEISGERLEILHLLQRNETLLIVVPVEAIMQCVIPRIELSKRTFFFTKGKRE